MTPPAEVTGSHDTPAPILLEQLLNLARASALEEMASGIAHELNQPLGAIATFSNAGERMLQRRDPMVAAAIEVLRNVSQEALAAGEGLRRIRRLFNRGQEHRIPIALGDLVRELEPVLRLLADRAGVALRVEVEPGLPRVSVDRRQIQHVLFTLVQNAIEACRGHGNAPGVSITTSCDGYTAEASVIDNGPGVPIEVRPALFHPFFTTKPGGTGLGLVSSRTIIEAHEGTIGFDAPATGGSRFWFRLPAAG